MTAEEKIEEAEYFLQKIIDSYENENEIKYNFSAFLSASRSIMEHLLEEYNQKYNLQIDERKDLTKEFQKIGKNNEEVRNMIQYFDNKLKTLRKEHPVLLVLKQKRNLNIHRSTIRPSLMIKIISDDPTMPIITYSHAGWFSIKKAVDDANTSGIPIGIPLGFDKHGLGNTKPLKITQSLYWYLNDYAELDLKEVCRIFLTLMKELVAVIHQEFP